MGTEQALLHMFWGRDEETKKRMGGVGVILKMWHYLVLCGTFRL
jgi:hypothetical protein